MTSTVTFTWNEPKHATSPRGWLHTDVHCVGFYLDYEAGHYRSPHSSILNTISGLREVTFCKPGDLCPTCQPGNILAVRYPNGPGTTPHDSRYVETIAEARRWVESGNVA